MFTFRQYIKEAEMDYQQVETVLNSMGYNSIKKITGNKMAILTNDKRVATLEKVAKAFKGAKYDTSAAAVKDSSAGRVVIGNILVLAKPASRQGTASAGVENEHMLVNFINSAAKSGPINIIFNGNNRVTFEVFGAVSAQAVGGDTANRKKADIVVKDYTGKEYPISIKKDNAEQWESADSYFGKPYGKKIVDDAIKRGLTKVSDEGGYFKIKPEIAVEATAKEKKDVVFGSDIEGKGCVITKTFTSASFAQVDDFVEIDCSHIITSMNHVKGDKDVFFLFRNDRGRRSVPGWPGLRVLAVYGKRINKNVVVTKR